MKSRSQPSPQGPPKAALIIRPDTMGDLVLFAPALKRLKEGWPKARIAVVVRRAYLDLARLLVSGIEWIPTGIDPFVQRPAETREELGQLRKAVDALSPDLVVAACSRRHWLDTALAAAAPEARRVAFFSNEEDPYFGLQVRILLGKQALPYVETARPAEGDEDWRHNHGLADYLLGKKAEPTMPSLSLDSGLLAKADAVLAAAGLEPGKFVACAAAGFANVQIKTWPAEHFESVITWLKRQEGVSTLLVGHQSERGYLEAVAGQGLAALWTGGEGELPLLAALLARSALYFGNDTGALHLAAALGRPTVAIFGGGTWPRFKPASKRGIALVHPLPCFGCGWDCPFGDAPCVQAVGEEQVRQALSDLLKGGGNPAEIREVRTLPEAVAAFMGRTEALARERRAAHLAREHKLEETVLLAGEKDGEIEALKAATNEKDAEIETKDEEIKALKAATNEKDAEIETKDEEIKGLKGAANEKDAEIASLKAATNEKDAEIESKDREISALAKACEERLQLIIRLDADVKRLMAEK